MSSNAIHHTPIDIGALIGQQLIKLGMKKAEFGRRMGLKSRGSINGLLNKANWDADDLLRASRILKHDFFEEVSRLSLTGKYSHLLMGHSAYRGQDREGLKREAALNVLTGLTKLISLNEL